MNIYVSNLGYDVTEQDLKKLFAQQGEVSSVKVITDYNTGASRGFAFLVMPNDSEAQKAIEKLNGTELNGRAISVQIAKPKEDNAGRSQYNSTAKGRW